MSRPFEFARPFDGTQPEISIDEQRHVGVIFSSFVDDVLLANFDRVNTSELPDLRSSLRLRQDSMLIYVQDSPSSLTCPKEIYVQEIHGIRGGDTVNYRLCRSGIVRRHNKPAQTSEQQQMEKAAGLCPISYSASLVEVGEAILAITAAAVQQAQNSELEQKMGLNNQPIGIDELNSLMALVSRSEIAPPLF